MRVPGVQRGEDDLRHFGPELSHSDCLAQMPEFIPRKQTAPSRRSRFGAIPQAALLRVSGHFFSSGMNLNFCPPTLASNIKPLLAMVYTCTPFLRSEEHTSELQSHSFISYAVFC